MDQRDDAVWIGNNAVRVDRSFDGIVDEVRISGTARSDDWIKLLYENQKVERVLVGPPKEASCVKNFGVVAATITANESDFSDVRGNAMCADQYQWVEVKGNTETFLSAGLRVVKKYPRITGQTTLTWRLKALYGSVWETSDTKITLVDVIPNPQFTITSGHTIGETWDGQTPFEIILNISNAAAITALDPPLNEINTVWSFSGSKVYKTFTESSVIINRAYENGTLNVSICLDNMGEVICETPSYPVTLPTVPVIPPSKGTAGKLKIFVLAGQSNMEGHGQTHGVDFEGSLDWLINSSEHSSNYQHLMDGGSPKVFDDVWVFYPREEISNYNLKELMKGPLSPIYGVAGTDKATIGPEYAMGIQLGDYYEDQVLLIKAAWGGHSLGSKFRPPGAGGVLGPSYTHMLEIVEDVTSNLKAYFPDYNENGYEIMGLGWHQGYNDQFCDNCPEEYAQNLGILIDDLRREWENYRMPVVIGESGMICGGGHQICQSQQETSTFSGFSGNVAFSANKDIYAENLGGGAGYHWYESFYNYYHVGDRMGEAMVGLLENSVPVVPAPSETKKFNLGVQIFANYINLSVSHPDDYTVTVNNIRGQLIKTFSFKNTNHTTIARRGLGQGVVTITLKSKNRMVSRKMVLM